MPTMFPGWLVTLQTGALQFGYPQVMMPEGQVHAHSHPRDSREPDPRPGESRELSPACAPGGDRHPSPGSTLGAELPLESPARSSRKAEPEP